MPIRIVNGRFSRKLGGLPKDYEIQKLSYYDFLSRQFIESCAYDCENFKEFTDNQKVKIIITRVIRRVLDVIRETQKASNRY